MIFLEGVADPKSQVKPHYGLQGFNQQKTRDFQIQVSRHYTYNLAFQETT